MSNPLFPFAYPLDVIPYGTQNAGICLGDGRAVGGVYRGGDSDNLTPEEADFIAKACNERAALVEAIRALQAVRRNVDVSTINQSKRSQDKWAELVTAADNALAKLPNL